MNTTVIASSSADAQAADAIREHHAQLSGALTLAVATVRAAAERGPSEQAAAAVSDLAAWCRRELLPHARAEEATLYPAARTRDEARLLVTAMIDEHVVLTDLVATLGSPRTGLLEAVAAAGALQTMFDSHLAKENDLLLPVLESASDLSLADLLGQMHHELGAAADDATSAAVEETAQDGHAHACSCGHHDEPGFPVLDAQTIPHAIRHATIFGALGALQVGGGLVLLAPHDPLPLLAQIEQAQPGRFEVVYLERGPQTWSLQLTRRS